MTADEGPPAAIDWLRVRREYEEGARAISLIAGDAGVTPQKLVVIAKREGWKLRGPVKVKPQATRETIARLKSLLQRRLQELEGELGALGEEAKAANSERDIRAMNTLARTLEKVLELERKDRSHRAKKRREQRHFTDAERDQLTARLEALRREWAESQVAGGQADLPPAADGEPRLAVDSEAGPNSA